MIVGFSGTRFGMTDYQKRNVKELLLELLPEEVHHGDCVGADSEFHDIVREVLPNCRIVIRPGPDGPNRAWRDGDLLVPEKKRSLRGIEILLMYLIG